MPSSVGRPRKYQTTGEQCLAHAASSACSYTRHKAQINKGRRKRYKRTKSKNEEFLNLIDRRPRVYAERLYREFMATVTDQSPQGDDTQLCDKLTKLGALIQDVSNYADKILNDVGVGKDLVEAQEIHDCMQEVEQWLEDILCGALEGVDVLLDAHQCRRLLYQTSTL
ncbi:hypothetical protein EDD18DRAFT_1108651 [Armillaria luteobubalina]|uniref:Uncharacterized protein n=1 Tax=Armillaria luteobubalina TaxID=153913 RepID=A0AA39PYT0_9AGAR|nr:hypothetical protein EDD18DRAFT_1108651 [Armillaria luteobubalina]